MKKIFSFNLIAIILLIFVCATTLNAKEETGESKDYFRWSLGTKGYYSTGASESYMYDKTFAKGEFLSDYFEISATIQRYFHYQLTDGNADYEYRSFNEAGVLSALYLFKIINLTGGYYRGDDFDNLTKNTCEAGIELDLSPVTLGADYSYEHFNYNMNSESIEIRKQDFSSQFDYAVSDAFSFDLGYAYSTIYFNSLGYSYYKNSIRAGISDIVSKYFYIIGGLSAGKDSSDYYIFGADLGMTVKMFSNIKLSFTYNINYYQPEVSATSASKKGSVSGSGNRNPYLSADKTGESFVTQAVSLGTTLTF